MEDIDFGYSDEIEERAYYGNRINEYLGSALIGVIGFWRIYCEMSSKKSLKNNVIDEGK